MSIIRVGLAETKKYSEGYDAIFGKKEEPKPATPAPAPTPPAPATDSLPAK
jgi:hypothetical protein